MEVDGKLVLQIAVGSIVGLLFLGAAVRVIVTNILSAIQDFNKKQKPIKQEDDNGA